MVYNEAVIKILAAIVMHKTKTRKPNLAFSIRDALQAEIESGELPPGAPLEERLLAARFSVSRTPVREAIQQLAAQNLIRVTPRQGVTVERLTVPQLRDMLELLGELEALCAKLAARRRSEDLRLALETALQGGRDAAPPGNSFDAYSKANMQFHEAIHAGSRNELLVQQVRPLRRLIRRYNVNVRIMRTPAQIEKSIHDHEQILQAIMAGDEVLSHRLMLEHVPVGGNGFSEFLSALPASFFEDPANS